MFHSCFNEYAFDDITINLLTSSCTLHRRKFQTNVSVHICMNLSVDFKFSHASDYVIVLNETDMSQTTGSVIASPKTSDNTPVAAAVILLLFGCALMGTAYRKNKKF